MVGHIPDEHHDGWAILFTKKWNKNVGGTIIESFWLRGCGKFWGGSFTVVHRLKGREGFHGGAGDHMT